MMKRFLLLATVCLVGCTSTQALAPSGPEAKAYFSGTQNSILASLRSYAAIFDVTSKEGQIDYLLQRLQTATWKLDRNGARFSSSEAAEFLRWKMNRPRWRDKVRTTEDFVTIICGGSVTSGKPYLVLLPDGSRPSLRELMQNELDLLNGYLAQNPQQEG